MFNKLALKCFYDLGEKSGGEFYYKSGAESVHSTIIEVLEDHCKNGSDIIFLIDKTGSMQNDIDSARINLNLIIDQVNKLDNIRLGVAAYGDKNVDGDSWWETTEISNDFQKTRDFINKLRVSDGGDYPESVYDGIANVVEKTDWREGAKKLILVIGDAPSLEGESTDHTRKDVLELCASKGVKANLFPILVTAFAAEGYVEYSEYSDKFLTKVYPNPASEYVNVEFAADSIYTATILDYSGKVMHSERIEGIKGRVNIPENVPDGNYILRVFDIDITKMNAEKIIIKH
jgi:hypothetical protein